MDNYQTAMTAKEFCKFLRKRLRVANINARVRIQPSPLVGSAEGIQVIPVRFDVEFTADESRHIKNICKIHGLTHVRGMEIKPDHHTAVQMDFCMPVREAA